MFRRSLPALANLIALAAPAEVVLAQATIEPLPIVTDGYQSTGLGVSGDGTTIVGASGTASSGPRAHRWKGTLTQNLGMLPGYTNRSEARGVSADGRVVVGYSRGVLYERGFRWTQAGGMEELPVSIGSGWAGANAISADGQVIVGYASATTSYRHACLWDANGLQFLGTLYDVDGDSEARAASADGRVIVGQSASDNAFVLRAFRWENGAMEDLGSLPGGNDRSVADDVSADGSVIVGRWNSLSLKAFRWTRATGMQDLPPVDGVDINRTALGLSKNGRRIVGTSSHDFSRTGGTACIWLDGQPRQLWDLLTTDYGLDLDALGWESLDEATACSANGSVITGHGIRYVAPAYVQTPFRVTIPRLNDPPSVEGSITDGTTIVAREGGTLAVTVQAWDADDADDLTLEIDGLPPGATLTPPAGTIGVGTQAAPFEATFEWTPDETEVGAQREVTISFRDELDAVVGLTFTIEVIENDAPTVDPLAPVTIECIDGEHEVELVTVVDDPDDDPLTVAWKVDGEIVRTRNANPGAEVRYSADYEHGEHLVEIVVSDGILETTISTTVTVVDTEDPEVDVTPRVQVRTDPGKAFASKGRIPTPTAEDATGHPVTFENDAPAKLSLGEHVVTWTATDIGGNQVTATQTVEVVDREKPKFGALPVVKLFCDPGKTFATERLKPPAATDNIPVPIDVTTNAKPQFKIGTTNVVWTARDAAGNVARKTQKVTVVNRKPKANAGRDIVVTTRSERGATVRLDGGASSDPDKHKLTFSWKARGAKLSGAKSAKPSGLFPVGATTVTLTVTDAGKAKDSDTMRVIVKLKNAKRRSSGVAANDAFAGAAQTARLAALRGETNGAVIDGFAHAEIAAALGVAAGEYVRWNDGQSEADAALAYAELRLLQKAYGSAATDALLAAYAETGDEHLLSSAVYSATGAAYAGADLIEP